MEVWAENITKVSDIAADKARAIKDIEASRNTRLETKELQSYIESAIRAAFAELAPQVRFIAEVGAQI